MVLTGSIMGYSFPVREGLMPSLTPPVTAISELEVSLGLECIASVLSPHARALFAKSW